MEIFWEGGFRLPSVSFSFRGIEARGSHLGFRPSAAAVGSFRSSPALGLTPCLLPFINTCTPHPPHKRKRTDVCSRFLSPPPPPLSARQDQGHVVGSPFRVHVVPKGLFNVGFWAGIRQADEGSAANFIISGGSLEQATAGERAHFDVIAKNLGELAPAEAFTAEFRGPELVHATLDGGRC